MTHINIKNIGVAEFPDDMPISDIRSFLRKKYYQDEISGVSNALDPSPKTIEATQPSLSERAGQAVSDVLFNSGIISDRYGAQQVGKTLSSFGEFLPVIGDATAGDEFGRALSKGDASGVALSALGAIPIAGDIAKKGIGKVKKLIDGTEISEILKSGKFEYHLSSEPNLEIGKSFSEQKRTVSELGERGGGGVDEKGIFSTKDPQSWIDQFEMELRQDAPEVIPKYLYKVRVKNKSDDGFLSEVINKPEDVTILERINLNDAP